MCTDENYNQIQRYSSLESDINAKNPQGRTPLWLAASVNAPKTVKFLLENYADKDTADIKNHCVIMAAVKNNAVDSLRVLLKAGCDPNGNEQAVVCPLSIAARENYVDCLYLLLLHGAIVDGREIGYANPLQQQLYEYQSVNRQLPLFGNTDLGAQEQQEDEQQNPRVDNDAMHNPAMPPPPPIGPMAVPPAPTPIGMGVPAPPPPIGLPPPMEIPTAPIFIATDMVSSVTSIQSNDNAVIRRASQVQTNGTQIIDYPGTQSPLHTAILYNNTECARLLIAFGADVNLPYTSNSIVWLCMRYQVNVELFRVICSLGCSMQDKLTTSRIVIPDLSMVSRIQRNDNTSDGEAESSEKTTNTTVSSASTQHTKAYTNNIFALYNNTTRRLYP